MTQEKRCVCGGHFSESLVKKHHSEDMGLPNVYLLNIKQSVCNSCGTKMIQLFRLERLLEILFFRVLSKQYLLSGDEIRLLRKSTTLSIQMFSKISGITENHLTNLESGEMVADSIQDRLIRSIALLMTDYGYVREHRDAISVSFTGIENKKAPPDLTIEIDTRAEFLD